MNRTDCRWQDLAAAEAAREALAEIIVFFLFRYPGEKKWNPPRRNFALVVEQRHRIGGAESKTRDEEKELDGFGCVVAVRSSPARVDSRACRAGSLLVLVPVHVRLVVELVLIHVQPVGSYDTTNVRNFSRLM